MATKHLRSKATYRKYPGRRVRYQQARVGAVPLLAAAAFLLVLTVASLLSLSGQALAAQGGQFIDGLTAKQNPSCGAPGKPACAPVNSGWIPVASDLPGDAMRAISASTAFASMRSRYGGNYLDLPALVRPLGGQAGAGYYGFEHWVATVRGANGQECGIFDFVYDRAHQRIRFSGYGAIPPGDPHYGHAFPLISINSAIAAFTSQRDMSVLAGVQPELVFLPLDPRLWQPNPPIVWRGGGYQPVDAVWHFVGADGKNYFLGTDQHVYALGDIPLVRPSA